MEYSEPIETQTRTIVSQRTVEDFEWSEAHGVESWSVYSVHSHGRDWHITIADRHPGHDRIVASLLYAASLTHPKLMIPLYGIEVPFDDGLSLHEDTDPTMTLAATAFPTEGNILYWGFDHIGEDYQTFKPFAFHHELAHLQDPAGETCGPPSRIAEVWEMARLADTGHQIDEALLKMDIFKQKVCLIGETSQLEQNQGRQLIAGDLFVTTYAGGQDKVAEDWAESVALYMTEQNHGYVWHDGVRGVTFSECYPNRTKLIRQWLDQ